ncbi:MAG TPA: hypothetical protein DCZ92_05180 [Elusimicrobia bacterium]|nr:MAG: hypothetical protein A2016_11010 [Elusimicrobia bacterium GWF2_62_30]HBA60198.1 hypothetical protein [Elusimicrobiota bacterium]
MIKLQTRKKKAPQYVVGGTVAVIILGLWISMPLMNGTASSSGGAGNPFNSRVSDISTLGTDIPQEGSAPGSPLSGEMTNNPATSGEDIAASLFQSGAAEEPVVSASADAAASAPSEGPGAVYGGGGGSSPSGGPAGKLAAVGSISGGSNNTMTAGGSHNKFFGSGNTKAELAKPLSADLKKDVPSVLKEKDRGAATTSLNDAVSKGALAMKSPNSDASRNDATTAFSGGNKGLSTSELGGKSEEVSAVSGLEMGQAAGDLKKNDPSINKHKVTMPKPVEASEVESQDEQMKQMIIQMILKAAIGMAFGA